MAIHRATRPDNHFTSFHNDVLRDDRLSYRARGILVVILSHSDGWSTSSEALASNGKEGRDAVRTALQELEDAGYLRRERRQDSQGRWATQQVIYDRPHLDEQPALFGAESQEPTTDFQASVYQASVSQASIETPEELPSPSEKGGKVKPPADLIATAVYDHAQGMVNYMAVRQVAGRALKVKVGSTNPSADTIASTMCALYDQGRPLTLSVVGQTLSRTSVRETNNDHWAKGGEF
jgi:hypothetical protein